METKRLKHAWLRLLKHNTMYYYDDKNIYKLFDEINNLEKDVASIRKFIESLDKQKVCKAIIGTSKTEASKIRKIAKVYNCDKEKAKIILKEL